MSPSGNQPSPGDRMTLDRTSLIDSIVSTFSAHIAAGDLKDGDQLASQDEIAKSLGVSRATLREALNRLSAMGLVEMRHGTGTFIRTPRPLDFIDNISPLLMVVDRASMRELHAAQSSVEPLVAGLAAFSATTEQLRAMRQTLDEMRGEAESGEVDSYLLLDMRFHTAIAESTRNRLLVKVLEIFCGASRQMAQAFRPAFAAHTLEIHQDHEEIYEAIARGDAAAAHNRMLSHISHVARLATESRS